LSQEENGIDFIIAWVDGNDREWKSEKEFYENKELGDNREERYRDWDMLRYWFRGVEEYAPWVNKIHFVTWGHIPKWLNTSHPKLHVVNHRDFIPAKYLPTFNINTIELNFHRIPELSEQFVYFNDDMFLINKVTPENFFIRGLPCDMLALQPIVVKPENSIMANIFLNNTIILSKYFKKRENIRSQPFRYFKLGYPPIYFFYNLLELYFPLFTGLYTVHGAAPLRKRTYLQLWEKEEKVLDQACRHRFRSKEDVNQYLLREWQKLNGDFYAKNVVKDFRYFDLDHDNIKLIKTMNQHRIKSICMNDTNKNIDFNKVKNELQQAFVGILPKKSQFECD